VEDIKEEQLGGKAVWEDSAEKREASLRERKAQMILAARQYVFFSCFSFTPTSLVDVIFSCYSRIARHLFPISSPILTFHYHRRLLAQKEAEAKKATS
jgi:hypothetical protein